MCCLQRNGRNDRDVPVPVCPGGGGRYVSLRKLLESGPSATVGARQWDNSTATPFFNYISPKVQFAWLFWMLDVGCWMMVTFV
jgi:hypothetical protein